MTIVDPTIQIDDHVSEADTFRKEVLPKLYGSHGHNFNTLTTDLSEGKTIVIISMKIFGYPKK